MYALKPLRLVSCSVITLALLLVYYMCCFSKGKQWHSKSPSSTRRWLKQRNQQTEDSVTTRNGSSAGAAERNMERLTQQTICHSGEKRGAAVSSRMNWDTRRTILALLPPAWQGPPFATAAVEVTQELPTCPCRVVHHGVPAWHLQWGPQSASRATDKSMTRAAECRCWPW